MAFFRSWLSLLPLLLSFFCLLRPGVTVKYENFKRCDQSGFCKRNRALADEASLKGDKWKSPYTLDPATINVKNGILKGMVSKSLGEGMGPVSLPLTVTFLDSGVARVTLDEEKRQKGDIELRHGSIARKERYNEVSKWAIVGNLDTDKKAAPSLAEDATTVTYGPDNGYKAVIKHLPFAIDFWRGDEIQVRFNEKGYLNMEHWRPKFEKPAAPEKEVKEGEEAAPEVEHATTEAGEDESTWWEESFGGNTDSKPKGPESIGLDITFPGYEHVYGIPQHTGPLSLKETRGGSGNFDDPYRLYNSDVFEYEMDSPMTLYGAITFMQAHRKDSSVGVFWLNAAETWIDIVKPKVSSNPLSLGIGGKTDTQTHWFSEAGLLDVFVFLGPTPKDVVHAYSDLTGYTTLPAEFSIAYHQCRWNYVSDEDVRDVDRKFDKNSIPYDVIWLDLEYTDDRKYFTFDSHTFPDPLGMQSQLDSHGRKLVVLIDPHIKNTNDYSVVDELKSKGLAIRSKDNSIYEGWCWPGSSHWIDCFSPEGQKWWTSLFQYSAFKGSAPNLHVWNDMNEPSVFNGPETTMPKDNIHYGNWEHRDLHNVNGLTFVNATYNALLARDPKHPKRPFVLTRSFYAGSQRMGAMWTGDNQASWPHLAASIPMILANNIAGFPFAGADVGGFFGNPSKELLTRWYQAGIFYPFFRAHAHIDTRRREPYAAGEPYTTIITQAIRLRYQLLSTWYTAFHAASISGEPIIKPFYYVHPSDVSAFGIDTQFYIGSSGLLASPIVEEGATTVSVYLPLNAVYYSYWDYTIYTGAGKEVTVAAQLEEIPLFMRAGHVFSRKDRPRKSSALMKWDPYTLVVVLDAKGRATGELYVDDGETFDYQSGAFIWRDITFDDGKLSSTAVEEGKGKKAKEYLKSMEGVRVEKVVVVNAPASWEGKENVSVKEDGKSEKSAPLKVWPAKDGKARWAVVKDPAVGVGKDWSLAF